MALHRWPNDPPGKPPSHTIPWAVHQANQAAQQQARMTSQQQNAVNAARQAANAGPAKGLTPGQLGGVPQAAGGTGGAQASGTPGTPASTPATFAPDAQFLAEAAQRAHQKATALTRLSQETSDDRTNTATAINRLLENAIKDRGQIDEGANSQGLYFSGQRDKRRGDYEEGLTRAKGDAQTAFDQREAARISERSAIEQGDPLDEAAARALAIQRQIGRDTNAADLGALVPNIASPTAAAASAALPGVGKPRVIETNRRDSKGRRGVYHEYPGGRRVWVPVR